jgi:hypothetical protein
MIRLTLIAMMLRFGTIDWVLEGGELTETKGESSEMEEDYLGQAEI